MNGTGAERALRRKAVSARDLLRRADILGIEHDAADRPVAELVAHGDNPGIVHLGAGKSHHDHLPDHGIERARILLRRRYRAAERDRAEQQKPGGKQRSKYGERQSEAPMAERQKGVAVL